jgi:hypothetical protein
VAIACSTAGWLQHEPELYRMPYGACPDVDLRWCPGVQEFTHHSVWNNDVVIET